jgi:hypothetical protein
LVVTEKLIEFLESQTHSHSYFNQNTIMIDMPEIMNPFYEKIPLDNCDDFESGDRYQ